LNGGSLPSHFQGWAALCRIILVMSFDFFLLLA
jgi:hypothetical protein